MTYDSGRGTRKTTLVILLDIVLLFFEIFNSLFQGPRPEPTVARRRNRTWLILLLLGLCCAVAVGGQAWAFSLFGEKTVEVTFTYPRAARRVCLAGDFNAWSPQTHCLKKERGVWTIRLKLKPGRYAYAFVLDDGKWTPDPGAMLLEDDGFGRKNSILIIK